MNKKSSLDKNGKWLYVFPITGVVITKELDYKFEINDINFVSNNIIKEMYKGYPESRLIEFFEKEYLTSTTQSTFAYKETTGHGKEELNTTIKDIEDACYYLMASQLIWGKRKQYSSIHIAKDRKPKSQGQLIFDVLNNKAVQA